MTPAFAYDFVFAGAYADSVFDPRPQTDVNLRAQVKAKCLDLVKLSKALPHVRTLATVISYKNKTFRVTLKAL